MNTQSGFISDVYKNFLSFVAIEQNPLLPLGITIGGNVSVHYQCYVLLMVNTPSCQ